jgi:hypothetical protein
MAKKNKKTIDLNIEALDRRGEETKLRTQDEILKIIRDMFESIIKEHPDEAKAMNLEAVVNNAISFIDNTSNRVRLYDSTEENWVARFKVPFEFHINYLELPYSPGPLFEFVDRTNNHSMVFGISDIIRGYMEHFEIKGK